ncbi:MAG: hypothetical protein M1840_000718 [Geoglossum simile]|nr:MAG: hypothetical protein M1840_000718 [Geoglossum simile]
MLWVGPHRDVELEVWYFGGEPGELSALGGRWHGNSISPITNHLYFHSCPILNDAPMALPDAWLTAVLDAGGDIEPPPDPQIPADYLQKPRRQHPASEQTQLLSSHLPSLPASSSRPKRRRTALAEIDHPNDPSLCQRRRAPNAPTPITSQAPRSPPDTRNGVLAVEDVIDPDTTPRSVRARRKPAPTPPATIPIPVLDKTKIPTLTPNTSEDKLDTDKGDVDWPTSSVTESTGSKARSRSPTKRMIDLRVAEKTVISKTVKSPTDVPEDVRGLYEAIRSLARMPHGVIPLGIEGEVKNDAGGDFDDLDPFVATKANGMTRKQLKNEFDALIEIRDSTAFCKTKQVHEPTWNERVHSMMLKRVVRNRPGFEYHNITTARVIKELVPGNKYGELLKNKMIDYAITLESPLFSEDQVITRLATSPRPLQRTINPSDYPPIRHSPIAISIETKSLDGLKESGEVQLSIWAMAYFNRLRTLTQDPVSITLPLVLVSDERWKLMFAQDLGRSIEIIDAVDFGDTGDIIGCYKILAALRLLCGWAEDTFLGWFSDKVLKPE